MTEHATNDQERQRTKALQETSFAIYRQLVDNTLLADYVHTVYILIVVIIITTRIKNHKKVLFTNKRQPVIVNHLRSSILG